MSLINFYKQVQSYPDNAETINTYLTTMTLFNNFPNKNPVSLEEALLSRKLLLLAAFAVL